MATTIDRRGYDDTMEGFDYFMTKYEFPVYWSVWNGRRLKDVCNDEDFQTARHMFDTLLQVWQRNGAQGAMEVRFHEKRPSANISNNADYVGSMVFKLVDDTGMYANRANNMQPVEPGGGSMSAMVREFQAFQALQAMMQPAVGAIGAVDDTPKTIWDRIEQFLTVPVVEDAIAGILKKFDVDMGQINREGAIAGDNDNTEQVLTYEDTTRLDAVIARLAVGENDVIGLLEKLADLKEKKPKQYTMAKTFL